MKKLVYYIIPLVVLVLVAVWQFGPSGLLEGVKDAMGVIIAIAPNVTVGAEEVSGEKVVLPKEHEDAIKKLVETIEQMIGSGNSNCFANYNGLPDLGKQGTMIMLKEGRIEISRKGRIVEDLTKELREKMEGFKPCVIAGTKNITENFFNYFIDYRPFDGPYFKTVNSIMISYETGVFTSGNHISVLELGEDIVNDEGDNFESQGWLFKAEDGSICFFPTNKNYDHDEDGIANEWFSVDKSGSIPWLVAKNPFIECKRRSVATEKWFYCNNKCTLVQADCGDSIPAATDSLEECQKLMKVSGRVIFSSVNWDGQGMSELIKEHFDYYSNFYNVKKEPVYLEGKNCQISEFESSTLESGKIKTCDELFNEGGSDSNIAKNKLQECVEEKLKDLSSADILVGVVNRDILGSPAYVYEGVIFMYSDVDEMTLAHEVGHRDFNYCDEYEYASPRTEEGFIECYEETDKTFEKYVNEQYQEISEEALSTSLKFNSDKTTAKINFLIMKGLGRMEIFFEKSGNRVVQTWNRFYEYGWKLSNTLRGCPNPYPSCCVDSPNWVGYDPRSNPYGTQCYPNNLPLPYEVSPIDKDYPERYYLISDNMKCIGGPCINPKPENCRSIMGPLGVDVPRGLPK